MSSQSYGKLAFFHSTAEVLYLWAQWAASTRWTWRRRPPRCACWRAPSGTPPTCAACSSACSLPSPTWAPSSRYCSNPKVCKGLISQTAACLWHNHFRLPLLLRRQLTAVMGPTPKVMALASWVLLCLSTWSMCCTNHVRDRGTLCHDVSKSISVPRIAGLRCFLRFGHLTGTSCWAGPSVMFPVSSLSA